MRDLADRYRHAHAARKEDCIWPNCLCDLDRCARAPAAARPQWGPVEKILIGIIVAVAAACVWMAW